MVAFQPYSEPLRAAPAMPSPLLTLHPSCGTLPGPAPSPPSSRDGQSTPCLPAAPIPRPPLLLRLWACRTPLLEEINLA